MKNSIVLISLVTLFSTVNTLAQNNAAKTLDRVDPRPFADNANHWYKGMTKESGRQILTCSLRFSGNEVYLRNDGSGKNEKTAN
jgi:hypothetical protein